MAYCRAARIAGVVVVFLCRLISIFALHDVVSTEQESLQGLLAPPAAIVCFLANIHPGPYTYRHAGSQ